MGLVFLFTSVPDFKVFFMGRMLVGFYGYCFQRVGFFKGYDSVKMGSDFRFSFFTVYKRCGYCFFADVKLALFVNLRSSLLNEYPVVIQLLPCKIPLYSLRGSLYLRGNKCHGSVQELMQVRFSGESRRRQSMGQLVKPYTECSCQRMHQ